MKLILQALALVATFCFTVARCPTLPPPRDARCAPSERIQTGGATQCVRVLPQNGTQREKLDWVLNPPRPRPFLSAPLPPRGCLALPQALPHDPLPVSPPPAQGVPGPALRPRGECVGLRLRRRGDRVPEDPVLRGHGAPRAPQARGPPVQLPRAHGRGQPGRPAPGVRPAAGGPPVRRRGPGAGRHVGPRRGPHAPLEPRLRAEPHQRVLLLRAGRGGTGRDGRAAAGADHRGGDQHAVGGEGDLPGGAGRGGGAQVPPRVAPDGHAGAVGGAGARAAGRDPALGAVRPRRDGAVLRRLLRRPPRGDPPRPRQRVRRAARPPQVRLRAAAGGLLDLRAGGEAAVEGGAVLRTAGEEASAHPGGRGRGAGGAAPRAPRLGVPTGSWPTPEGDP